jgi:4-hydroxy-tetrahydrodipicolinate synthase
VPVIAGSGTNCTVDTIRLTKLADEAGADAFLVVGPYYNKPSMEGMAAHYGAVAKCTKKDILIYNIPGRTAKNIEPKAILDIARANPNIVGLKDAAGSMDQTMDIISGSRGLGKKFCILAGDDQMTYPTLALGGHGAISAVSHVVGAEMVEMARLAKEGRWDEAREIHFSILPVIRLLFLETNPAPVKAAMEMMGVIRPDQLRLPLVPMSAAGREKLKAELKALGKI